MTDGGAGDDAILLSYNHYDTSTGKNVTVTGGYGNDYIISSSNRGILFEYNIGDGYDTISAFNVNDTLQINDSSYSTMISGDDFIVLVGTGAILLEHSANFPVKIRDALGNLNTYNTNPSYVMYGTDYSSVMSNTNEKATILGYAGNDSLYNYSDNVVIYGGDGHDDIHNVSDNIYISGGNGAESIESTGDNGLIFGDAGNDTLIVHQGKNNTLDGGENNDLIILETSDGFNAINYRLGDGYDTVYGFTAKDVLWAYDTAWIPSTLRNDIVLSFQNGYVTLKDAATIHPRLALNITDNTTTGTIGAATEIIDANTRTKGIKITCNELANEVYGGYGNDSLYGGAGNDKIYGNDGNDRISGDDGKDTIDGGAGADVVWGGKGNDFISGGTDNDSLVGYDDNDTIKGGDGK